MVERGLSFQARREVLAQVLPRYREASADQKCLLLDEFAQITGYHRKYAMWLLNHIEQGQRAPVRPRSCRYGSDEQQALVLAWNAANRICTKRLMPFLPTLIEALERHGHLHLTEACRSQRLSMSAATADRLLFCPQPVPNYDLNTSSVNTTDKKRIQCERSNNGRKMRCCLDFSVPLCFTRRQNGEERRTWEATNQRAAITYTSS